MEEVPRTVRKIRVQREEIPPNPNNYGRMTWEEALNKNLIKAGMTVRFQNTEFKDIKISHDESGVEQTISGKLTDGIIVHDKEDNSFYIITLANFDPCFKLSGRFGMAFGAKAVQKVADNIYNQTSIIGLERKMYEHEMACRIAMYSKFFINYLYSKFGKYFWLVEANTEIDKKPRAFSVDPEYRVYSKDIERDYTYKFYGIMFVLHVKLKDIINLEKCSKVETSEPISINLNMFDSYITM